VEQLRDEWRLVLNVDPETNADDEGKDLGVTAWRCLIRCDPLDGTKGEKKYAEVILDAENLRAAEETAFEAVDGLREDGGLAEEFEDHVVVSADRLDEEGLRDLLGSTSKSGRKRRTKVGDEAKAGQAIAPLESGTVRRARWL
jgi:hypothetical protein